MESRMLDYRHLGGSGALDYHPTPLIGEMATNNTLLVDYHHPLPNNHLYHRSIDTLRMLNERGQLFTVQQGQQSPSSPHHPVRVPHEKNTNTSVEDISNQLIYQHHSLAETSGGLTVLYNGHHQTSLDQQLHNKIDGADGDVASFSSPTNSSAEVDEKLVLANSELEAIGRASSSSSPISRGCADSTSSSGTVLDPDIFIKQEDVSPGGCKIFSSKADLQLHTQIHMREAKPYKCSQCSKAFANSSYLSQHTRIHLGIKPYRCEICQRKFTQLSHLQQHIRTHTGDKPYKCRHPGCQKAFSQLSNLQSHSRCHQTDKPYKCNSCYKCFSDEPSLLEHIPKHKESKHLKTHICQYCGKSYTQETYLSKHMQKHAERTDKRPPITTGMPGATGVSSSAPVAGLNNRNLSSLTQPPMANGMTDHPYWPKVSPDSAASITEVMQQQQQQQHQQQHQQHQQQQHQQQHQHAAAIASHHDFSLPPPQQINGHNIEHLHQSHHHARMLEGHGRSNGDDVGEDLVVSRQNSANGLIPTSLPPPPSSVVSSGYENLPKTSSNSAFTPINSMTPHLNSLGHHPMAQRPYLYDAISFQNKQAQQNTANAFPNQLISLHQIRNYAHQPSGLMSGEHLLGVSVGKDKG